MIVGLGGDGLGITRPQMPALQDLLRRMQPEGAVHRGCTGMESMIHNVIRSVYSLIPVHVMPIAGKYSSIASQPLANFPQTIIYQADTAAVVNKMIVEAIHGLIYLPERMVEGGEGWALVELARKRGIAVVFVWPNGKVTLEHVEI